MKILVQSDQHLESYPLDFEWSPPEADVFVCAGDLTLGCDNGVRWLAENVAPHMEAVYTAGNHEFYRNSLVEGLAAGIAEAKLHPRVHFLENDLKVIDGVRFVGCTLWTDFAVEGQQPLALMHAAGAMNDYKLAAFKKKPYERLQPRHTQARHYQSRSFLEAALKMPFDGKTVVVTHHAPHPLSIHDRFKGDLLTASFCSDLDELIDTARPALWIHGHMHDSFDYLVGETRVVCNPRGYGDENRGFQRWLTIEI